MGTRHRHQPDRHLSWHALGDPAHGESAQRLDHQRVVDLGQRGGAGAHAYHATKGAVRNMSKSAAISYAKDNVRVNSVHPGFIKTVALSYG